MSVPSPIIPLNSAPAARTNACIQGLRGLAAFSVVMYHLHFMSAKAGFTEASRAAWAENVGPYAVLLFFCISGYLIVSTLHKHGDVRRFAWNRMLRVYPLFIVLHLVMFTIGPVMNYEWMGDLRHDPLAYAGHFLSNLFFLPGLFDLPIAQKNAWSLSYEAAFYLVAGTVFAGHQKWRSFLGKAMCVLGWLACVEACVLVPKLAFFALGALVWWLDAKRLLRLPPTGPMSIVGCVLGLMLYSTGHVWLAILGVLPFFVDVVRQEGWTAPLLQSRTMMWFGKISYSLYLVHPFVLDPLRRIGIKVQDRLPNGMAHSLFVVGGAIAALIAGAIAHELIEVRLTRRLAAKATRAGRTAARIAQVPQNVRYSLAPTAGGEA